MKAMRQLLCIRAAPGPYLLASICTMTCLDLSSTQGCTEQGLADPGFKVLESCICRGIPVSLGQLFMEEHCFSRQTGDEWLQVVYQS